MYRVRFRCANRAIVALVTTAAMLAICLLALVETTNATEAEDSLPENGKIAFHSGASIYTVGPDGSNVKLLIPSSSLPKWSPDGTEIVVAGGDIRVTSADGSSMRDITSEAEIIGYWPTWSADGTSVAFSGTHFDIEQGESIDRDIFMVDLDNLNKTTLRRTPKVSETFADFSPDGSQVCFSHFDDYVPGLNPSGIYVMDVHRSDPTLLFEDITQGPCDWSPDGKKLVFSASSDPYQKKARETEVYVINADGSGLTNLTSNSAEDINPAWSPDGTKIVFSSDRDGGDLDLYTMDADGSDIAQVVNARSGIDDSDWQPLPKPTPPKVHQPDTGGPSLLLVASALLFSGGVMFYAGLKRRM